MTNFRNPDELSQALIKICTLIVDDLKKEQKVFQLAVEATYYNNATCLLCIRIKDMWDLHVSLTFDCAELRNASDDNVLSVRVKQQIENALIYARLKRAKELAPREYKQVSQKQFIQDAHWHFTSIFSRLGENYPAGFFENDSDHTMYLLDKYGEGHYYYDSLYTDFPDDDFFAEWNPEDGFWYTYDDNGKRMTVVDFIEHRFDELTDTLSNDDDDDDDEDEA